MPIDFYEDLMPRNAPKPAPLIEIEATPLVPEVSLLFDQERNKSILLNANQRMNTESKLETVRNGDKNGIPFGNQYESYNTWKAKHAHLLSDITGSSHGQDIDPRYSNIRNNNGTQRDNLQNKEVHQTEGVQHDVPLRITRQLPCAKQIPNKPEHGCSSGNGYSGHQPVQTDYQERINPSNMYVCYPQSVNDHAQPISKEVIHHQKQYQDPSTFNQSKPCCQIVSNSQSPINKELRSPILQPNTHQNIKSQQNAVYYNEQVQTAPDNNTNKINCNQGQCPCGNFQCGVTSNNRVEYVNSQPCITKEDRSKDIQTSYGKLISPLEVGHVNNQAIRDLYHIVNLQNEQIFMLQQQVKQVLQLHSDCQLSAKQNFNCQSCPCVQKNSAGFEKAHCLNVQNGYDAKNNTHNVTESYEKPKRSIGVMTSSIEKPDGTSKNHVGHNHPSSKVRQKKKMNAISVAPFRQPSHLNHRDLGSTEERVRKKTKEQKLKKKSSQNNMKKPNQVETTQVDNSFSLNEADLVLRTISEQDDISPNTSVHVDLQDYCSSSTESGSQGTESSSDENEENPESEDGSIDPPLSWTFYNRVIGQVNKILKDTPSPPQQERPEIYRPPPHPMYNANADYETENNWSKRVTFDGPPLEDSDHNMPYMKDPYKFSQSVPQQDMKINDGHGRMQDFMMYNFANGNTNLSFATLRYLDQYNQLPSQKQPKQSEQIYHGYQKEQRSNKRSTKKKTRNSEKYSDIPQQISKRKSSTPSSKLLDITALKQQPKLF